MTRLILILLIIFLIARAFILFASDGEEEPVKKDFLKKNSFPRKGVPKEIGEYVEYEEMKE